MKMTKLREKGIFWIDDSEMYVADISLFANASDFLHAVISHIKAQVDSHSEQECGWFLVPDFDKYIKHVGTSWMVHRLNYLWDWEMQDEKGRGNRQVWMIDFDSRG